MRILLIEDQTKISNLIKQGLKEEGHAVDVASDGEQGYFLLHKNKYDLVVLDVVLPKTDGLSLCKRLRSENINLPIIILSAKNTVKDKVQGLNAGADDYLAKPFSVDELLARVRVFMRKKDSPAATQLKVGELVMDLLTHKVTRGGKPISLTVKEYTLLEFMMRNAGQVVTRTMISEQVWDIHFDTFTNVIDVYVNYLRNKVDKGFKEKMIVTVRGKGYMLKKI